MSDAQPITGCRPGDIAPNVFVCGDPARVARIAADWDERRTVRVVREYTIVSGSKDGVALTAASHGIGAPGTAVLVEELIKLGATTIIRIGNSGGLDPGLELGDLAITTGCVRDDGTSKTYVVPEFPAVADYRSSPRWSRPPGERCPRADRNHLVPRRLLRPQRRSRDRAAR